MSDHLKIVTIDGPSGVGKSTVSRIVSRMIGFTYLDTGAMYRAVALKCVTHGVDIGDEAQVVAVMSDLDIQLLPAQSEKEDVRVVLDGNDVSRKIRTQEISMLASAVSALRPVRERLTKMQQDIGARGRIVAEGRDTGTVVFPDAAWKFFLDATPQERARRRIKQLQDRGVEVNEKEILEQILKRDRDDRARTIAPLKAAPDAILINSTDMKIEDVVGRVLEVVQKK